MNPQDFNQLPEPPAVKNPLSVMQPGEHVICEIKRHPFGILPIYLGEGLFLIALAVMTLIVAPNLFDGDNRGQILTISAIFFFILAAVSLAFVFIANFVYWGNRWIVTSDSITQVTQTSLFHKQSSQLSLGSLEDVMSEQHGILASLFHFGVLRAETAGERSKFIFSYCPNPNYYAQKILAAREAFEQTNGKNSETPPAQQQPSYSPMPPMAQQPTAEPPQPPIYPSQPPTYNQPPAQPAPPPQPPQYQPPDNSIYPENTDGNPNF